MPLGSSPPWPRQREKKRWFVPLARLVFALALINNQRSCDVQADGGAVQRDRGWTSDIGSVPQKVAPMAGTLEALLRGVPDGGTPQMGTNGNESIEAVGVADDPRPLGFLEAGADFPDLVVVRFARLEE